MSVLAIWSWSSAVDDADDVRSALKALVDHCETEHPLIRRLDWFSAPRPESSEVEFRWIEEYESREAMESDQFTDVCESLWDPIKSHASEGTFGGSVWDHGGGIER